MSVAITSENSIAVGWTIPAVVIIQQTAEDVYAIAVTPDCKNGQNAGIQTPSPLILPYDGDSSVEISGLRKFKYYSKQKTIAEILLQYI